MQDQSSFGRKIKLAFAEKTFSKQQIKIDSAGEN